MENPTEDEKLMDLIIENAISVNHTIHKIERLSHQDRVWIKELKNYGNLFLKRLMKVEVHFDDLAEIDSIVKLYEGHHDFMKEINGIHISDITKFTNVIRALKKDEKSVLGISKKVLGKDFEE